MLKTTKTIGGYVIFLFIFLDGHGRVCDVHTSFQAHHLLIDILFVSSRTRLLRANLLQPLKDIETINARLDCLVSVNQVLSSLT